MNTTAYAGLVILKMLAKGFTATQAQNVEMVTFTHKKGTVYLTIKNANLDLTAFSPAGRLMKKILISDLNGDSQTHVDSISQKFSQ